MKELDVKPGYLNDEALDPDEIAAIEARLLAARRSRPGGRMRRPLQLAAAAALVASLGFFLLRQPSRTVESSPLPVAVVAAPRSMVLEIQRTDLPEAKPYSLIIHYEAGETPVDSEVQP